MNFEHRFIPNTDADRQSLLQACGVDSIEKLLVGIPSEVRLKGVLANGPALSEMEIKKRIQTIMRQSRYMRGALSFIGAGIYDHYCPAAVNQLTLRGEFLTSYTPYQPEMSQGTLQALFEFQTMVAELFAMDVSNASHYDGSTSLAEAALMAMRLKKDKKRILVSHGVHPEYINVMKTYLTNLGVELSIVPLSENGTTSEAALKSLLSDDVMGFVCQSPNFMGVIENQQSLSDITKSKNALYISNVTEPLSLGLLKPPGDFDADIATGEGQSFGLPQSFGGPYVGLFTAKAEYVRQMPGRLCGETVDAQNRRSYALTLSTREQHIRREKATSNICTNQNLFALWGSIWLAMTGKQGFKILAEQNLAKAEFAKEVIQKTGKAKLRYSKSATFNEFVIELATPAAEFARKAIARGIAPGVVLERFYSDDKNGILVAVTEQKSREDIESLALAIKELA